MSEISTLLIIAGPTAVGKTRLAIAIAQHYRTEIISCDSRQLYKEMNIGTAKPTATELNQVKHHFIDHISLTKNYTAADYESESQVVINSLFSEGKKLVVMTGGTGLYIDAVIKGFDKIPTAPISIIEELQSVLKSSGIETLQKMLYEKDPEYYLAIDKKNPRRLIRALSVIQSTGNKYSSYLTNTKKTLNFRVVYVVLDLDRELLYSRINDRVDKMIDNGLVDEVKSLLNYRNNRSMKTVGYQELFEFLDGNFTLQEAVSKIKQHTRNYAKRQITWFKKVENALRLTNDEKTFDKIIKAIENVDLV